MARKQQTARLSPEAREALSDLNPRVAALVTAYATPGSDTVGNGAASYVSVVPGADRALARKTASRILAKPEARRAMTAILDSYGMGRDTRAEKAAALIRDDACYETVVDIEDADGNLQKRVRTVNKVRPEAKLKSIDLLNKMDGLYEENKVAGDVAKEAYYRELDSYAPGGAVAGRGRMKRARAVPTPQTQVESRSEAVAGHTEDSGNAATAVGGGETTLENV